MPLLDVAQSMLLVIDAQEGFYPDDRRDVDRARLADVFLRVAWIVAVAERLKVSTVVTEEEAAVSGRTAAVIREALPDCAPVLPKSAFGAAGNPEIVAAIEATGASTTVLVGLETDICVAQTALGLQEIGKRAVAVHDALYSPGASHENGLCRMERAGIELLSAKEVVYDWLRTIERVHEFFQAYPTLANPPGFAL